jgi:hypothetical protein
MKEENARDIFAGETRIYIVDIALESRQQALGIRRAACMGKGVNTKTKTNIMSQTRVSLQYCRYAVANDSPRDFK